MQKRQPPGIAGIRVLIFIMRNKHSTSIYMYVCICECFCSAHKMAMRQLPAEVDLQCKYTVICAWQCVQLRRNKLGGKQLNNHAPN